MSIDDIRMSSKDLLDKKEIDSGGFGKVYLCCHRAKGLVALKTVFTGNKTDSYNKDLYEEGKMMYKLNHERIVKLLGIILEDGNYALVIEYMTKGNLLHVLKQVNVPVSLKARFIMEIIEGMMYLHNQNVIHKDLKPENILADDEFHVKIADLGVAAFQKWSTLTKEETARQRTYSQNSITTKNAGTLSYMAPEHLQSLNRRATKKSDIYSFAIVVWVILTNKEPYENAINSRHLSHCVTGGDRPDVEECLQCGLGEAADLMQLCWKEQPDERPTFQDCENKFRPIYSERYEKYVANDLKKIQESYPKPDAFIQRMASLQLDCDAEPPSIPRDVPLSLHSSGFQYGNMNEASFYACINEPVECEEEKCDELLERKLQDEMNYHQAGSRIDNITNPSNPPSMSELRNRKVFSEPQEWNSTPVGASPVSMPTGANTKLPATNSPSIRTYPVVMPIDTNRESPGRNSNPSYAYPGSMPYGANSESSAYTAPSYTHNNIIQSPNIFPAPSRPVEYQQPNEPMYFPAPQPFAWNTNPPISSPLTFYPNLYTTDTSVPFDSTKLGVIESGQNLYPLPQSYPYNPVGALAGGIEGSSLFPKGNFGYSPVPGYAPEKSVNLTISNSTAFQIGTQNTLNFSGDSDKSRITQESNQYTNVLGSNALMNEKQMQLLRDNLSKKWKAFARAVGFCQPEIDEIDHDWERDGLKEKVYQMLHRWQMKEGSKSVTVGKVATALYNLKHTDLLNQLIMLN
ncbi:hypothetical protein GDO81_011711 [Engystomops pustulosus]|uniref:Receptor-interacting serine/threonine-protein kinase 1 n=1 Tax=Engystomops pustulosus TaxID=76066 RepID=A0AAV7BGM7_ENGPU|nr:hypothetical protein GDO81_011711 [Engystomops pustulosus]